MKYAPVIIPTLCRAAHFERLIESLLKNPWAKYTELWIAVDLPPSEKYVDGYNDILDYLEKTDLSGFKKVSVIKRKKNYGAFGNIDNLMDIIAEKHDRWICLPDDVTVSPNFIEYMDKCLDRYENDTDMVAVCGYSYPVNWDVSEGATCFKQNINCAVWGVGFWKDKYYNVKNEIENGKTLGALKHVIKEKRYERMIDACKREYILAACYKWCYGHKWLLNMSDIGLRAYLGVFNKYAISPTMSKCQNSGFDGSGAFCPELNGAYDYSKQPIDRNCSWELVEDKNDNFKENRRRLNEFDYRTPQKMAKCNRLIWLCNNVGIWAAKLYCITGLPHDFCIRAYNKYIKR